MTTVNKIAQILCHEQSDGMGIVDDYIPIAKQIVSAQERYCLEQDNDCHWYVIPVAKKQQWMAWLEIDSDDERAWTPPEFAKEVGGLYSNVTFLDPEIK